MISTLNNFTSDSMVADFTLYALLPRNPSRCTNGQADETQAQKALAD